jgi:hypothetical protein
VNRFVRMMGLCFVAGVLLFVFPTAAQSETPVSEPPFSLKQFIIEIRQMLAPYRVVYVATPDDDADLRDNQLGADYLADMFGIIHVSTLDETMREDAREPVQAVIVTPLALAQSSIKGRGWLAESYRHGMVVTFVNVSFAEHLRTLKIRCNKGRFIPLVDYPTDWSASYQFHVDSPNKVRVNATIEQYDNCGEFPWERNAGSATSIGSGNDAFREPYGGLFAVAMTGIKLMNRWEHHVDAADKWGFAPVGYWQ